MLPTMDGFAVLESIRKRADASKDVPIIVVSNLRQEKDKDARRVWVRRNIW